jgi:hypothetical protein
MPVGNWMLRSLSVFHCSSYIFFHSFIFLGIQSMADKVKRYRECSSNDAGATSVTRRRCGDDQTPPSVSASHVASPVTSTNATMMSSITSYDYSGKLPKAYGRIHVLKCRDKVQNIAGGAVTFGIEP